MQGLIKFGQHEAYYTELNFSLIYNSESKSDISKAIEILVSRINDSFTSFEYLCYIEDLFQTLNKDIPTELAEIKASLRKENNSKL